MNPIKIGGSAAQHGALEATRNPQTSPKPPLEAGPTHKRTSTGAPAPRAAVPAATNVRAEQLAPRSLEWLGTCARSQDAEQAALASALLNALRDGKLEPGPPHPFFLKYGGRLTLADQRTGVAVIVLRGTPSGALLLHEAGFRPHDGSSQIRMQAPTQAQTQAPAQAQTQAPTQAPTQATAAPVPASPGLSAQARRAIDKILEQLPSWDRPASLQTIEDALGQLPPKQSQLLAVNVLAGSLSGRPQLEKAGAISNWAKHLRAGELVPDYRSTDEKRLHERLEAARQDPEFVRMADEVAKLFSVPDRKALQITDSSVRAWPGQENVYRSMLYTRVMADARPPSEALSDILQTLRALPDSRARRAALRGWQPEQPESMNQRS